MQKLKWSFANTKIDFKSLFPGSEFLLNFEKTRDSNDKFDCEKLTQNISFYRENEY